MTTAKATLSDFRQSPRKMRGVASLVRGKKVSALLQKHFGEMRIEELAKPFDLNGIHCQIGTSIGIAMAPSHGLDADTLIAIADQSMYEAKRSGRNQYRLAEIPAIC